MMFWFGFVGSCYRIQIVGGKMSSYISLFVGFYMVSPGPIEGSSCMRFWLLEVVPMGEYTASVICWLLFISFLLYDHVLFKTLMILRAR